VAPAVGSCGIHFSGVIDKGADALEQHDTCARPVGHGADDDDVLAFELVDPNRGRARPEPSIAHFVIDATRLDLEKPERKIIHDLDAAHGARIAAIQRGSSVSTISCSNTLKTDRA
jgi:hypothetical protein